MKTEASLSPGYIAPECRDIDFTPDTMLCTSQGGNLDGFDPIDDKNFFN